MADQALFYNRSHRYLNAYSFDTPSISLRYCFDPCVEEETEFIRRNRVEKYKVLVILSCQRPDENNYSYSSFAARHS